MDKLHYDLFRALDALSGTDDASFCTQFTAFVGQMELAFREEDMWMEELELPAIATHQEQHARTLSALHHVHAQVMGGDFGTGRYVVEELLPQWLPFHIATMDAPLALAMQANGNMREPCR